MTTEQLIQLGVAALTVVFSALAIRNAIRTRRALRQAEQAWARAAENWRKAADNWRKVADSHARRSEDQGKVFVAAIKAYEQANGPDWRGTTDPEERTNG